MTKAVLLLCLIANAVNAQTPLPGFGERIDRRLDAPALNRLFWGVAITAADGTPLYQRNAERLFIPASNTKLVVAVTATALLGPNFTVTTSVYGSGSIADSVLQGDLILYGRGDPTFSRRCYAADTTRPGVCDGDAAVRLRDLAKQLRMRGIRRIAGDLVGDGSYFEETLIHPAWQNYDLGWYYAAPVSGLGFNDNSIDVREVAGDSAGVPVRLSFAPDLQAATLENRATVGPRGSERTFDIFRSADGANYLATGVLPAGTSPRTEYLAVLDPNQYTALAFRRELQLAGITVTGAVRSTVDSNAYRTPRAGHALAEVRSRPFGDWLFPILSSSQNWFAEMTLKQLGKRFGTAGSWEEGRRIERRFLIDSAHIDSTQFAVEDGSGLAANNLVSPMTFASLLRFVRALPGFPAFQAALAVGGKSGSLRSRFAGTDLEGRVHAKTGTISRVSALSGFLERSDGPPLIFSILANHHTLTSAQINAAIDGVVLELGRRVP